MSTIGMRLKALRENRNMTQAEAEEAIGVARSTYATYELGTREPGIDNILKICRFYNITADMLIPTEPDPDVQYIEIRTRDIGRELTPFEKDAIEVYARFITRGKNL